MRTCSSPSTLATLATSALQSRLALATTASSTLARSDGEDAMTRRISLVAVCCS